MKKILMMIALALPCWVAVAQGLQGNNPALPAVHASVLAWADYDLDGDEDLLMAGVDSSGASTVLLLRNAGAAFVPVTVPFAAWSQAAGAWGDLDGDGDLDLLLTGAGGLGAGKGLVALWRNDGVGGFVALPCGLPGVRGGSVAWADLDGDGDQDCVVSGQNYDMGYVTVVGRNDPAGGTSGGRVLNAVPSGLPGFCCGDIAAGDVGGSAWPDLVLTGQDAKGNAVTRIWLNGGGLQFSEVTAVGGLPDMMDGSVAVADMEGDGDGDLLAMGMGTPWTLGLWRNEGGVLGEIGLGLGAGEGVARGAVRWADFDGDGLMDFVYCGLEADGVSVTRAMRQSSVGVFGDVQALAPLLALSEPRIALADWSGDGHPDLALSGIGAGGVPVAVLYKWNLTLQIFEP